MRSDFDLNYDSPRDKILRIDSVPIDPGSFASFAYLRRWVSPEVKEVIMTRLKLANGNDSINVSLPCIP